MNAQHEKHIQNKKEKMDKVKAGKKKQDNEDGIHKFTIHKEFATCYCPIFKAALHSGFIEGQTQTYTPDNTTPNAVRLMIHWFYTQTLNIQQMVENVPILERIAEDDNREDALTMRARYV